VQQTKGKQMNFSKSIKSRYKAKGWSESELARRAGISRSGLNEVITGKANIDLPRLIKVAKALDVNVWELVKEAESYE
jgi:transcriptional regulator with XRE-family HTH domain